MPLAIDFFLHFAYVILFLWVMGEQLGVPVPSLPLLLAAGTLTATHKLSLPLVLFSAVAGCFVSDSLWYMLGKRFGGTMVKLVCRLSFERSTCVRKTEDYFTKYGEQALLVAKFIPGLGTVAAPIAGQTGMKYRVFLAYDLAGALFWAAIDYPDRPLLRECSASPPRSAFVDGPFRGRPVSAGHCRLAGLPDMEAAGLPEAGSDLAAGPGGVEADAGRRDKTPLSSICVIRSTTSPTRECCPAPSGSRPKRLMQRSGEIPRDRDVILYCTCPSEATAAKMAMKLRQNGIYRVRPLLGGFDQWKKLGFPLEQYEDQPASIA